MTRHQPPPITRSSGNVFTDLGFEGEEAEHLRVRSELMTALQSLITAQNLTQLRAAELLGISQPRVSELVRGRIERFSIDMLVTLLARAGMRVDLVALEGVPTRR
jgi:predicted XRE-type DNA-binding protein